MKEFVTVEDVMLLWRPLQDEEMDRCKALLKTVSDMLRLEAEKMQIDLDKKAENEVYLSVLKSVVTDIVSRTMMTATDGEPLSQFSQSALGYTVSGTYLTPGGGIFIKNSELQRLGLRRQRYGVIDFYETERNTGYFGESGEDWD